MSDVNNVSDKEKRVCGILFIVLWTGLLALFLFTAKIGVPSTDESFFYTVSMRILQGDRLIVDEWNLGQFGYILNVPAVWLYMKLSGGTEGLILFMRYVFIAVYSLFSLYMYKKLRFLGAAGAVAALVFFAVIPETIFALFYFTFYPMAVITAVLGTVFPKKKKSAAALIIYGAALAVGVMTEPLIIFVYFIYAAAVLLRLALKKRNTFLEKYETALNVRTFLCLSAGAFAVFAAFMGFLFATGSLSEIRTVLPYLFSGMEYNSGNILDERKVFAMLAYYGPFHILLLFVCAAAALVTYIKKKNGMKLRLALFSASGLLLAACYAHALTVHGYVGTTSMINSQSVPAVMVCVIWFLLHRSSDGELRRRMEIVLIAGLMCGAAVDISSTAVLGSGAAITAISGAYGFFGFSRELKQLHREKKTENAKNRRLFTAAAVCCMCVCAVSAVFWRGSFVYLETLNKPIEHSFAVSNSDGERLLNSGPYKGLITTGRIANIYENTLKDCDVIKQNAGDGRVAVLSLEPFTYLYMGLPVGMFSAWVENEPQRMADYWDALPKNRPEYIYLPAYDNMYYMKNTAQTPDYPKNVTDMLSEICEYEIKYMKTGYIVKVTRWFN